MSKPPSITVLCISLQGFPYLAWFINVSSALDSAAPILALDEAEEFIENGTRAAGVRRKTCLTSSASKSAGVLIICHNRYPFSELAPKFTALAIAR